METQKTHSIPNSLEKEQSLRCCAPCLQTALQSHCCNSDYYQSSMVWCWNRNGLPQRRGGKESTYNAGGKWEAGWTPGLGRSPEGGNGNPLQYSCLENPLVRGACWAIVHWVTNSRMQLNISCETKQTSVKQNESPEINAHTYGQLINDKGSMNIQLKRQSL